jgi:hypothetical protein
VLVVGLLLIESFVCFGDAADCSSSVPGDPNSNIEECEFLQIVHEMSFSIPSSRRAY